MNDEPLQSRWRFTVRDLAIAVACISLLLALIVQSIQAARERERSSKCKAQLQGHMLAVESFHEMYNGLPPLGLGEGHAGFFLILEPHVGYSSNFLLYGQNQGANCRMEMKIDGANGSWSRLTPLEQEVVSRRSWMRCPGRGRGSIAQVAAVDSMHFGPISDYAVVFFNGRVRGDPSEFRAVKDWELHYDSCDERHVERQFGAIRLATIDCRARGGPEYKTWKPRDTFNRIIDGTANTLIIGEKYVRRGELNRYADDPELQDGTYLFEADQRRSAAVCRNLWFPLATSEDDPRFRLGKKASPQRDFGFGGPHAEGVLFGVADGSVKAVDRNTNRTVLYRLGHCQDSLGLQGVYERNSPEEELKLDDPKEPPVPAE